MENKAMQGVEAGGFLFLNGEDAALADKERKQIEYLEKHLDYKNAEQVLSVYQKLIEERTFKTPVGVIYLKHLQDFLTNKEYIAKVQAMSNFTVIGEANKPSPRVMKEFLKSVNIEPSQTVVVGDRPLTDILAGKLLGAKTILVDSITKDIENKPTRFVRALERLTIKK